MQSRGPTSSNRFKTHLASRLVWVLVVVLGISVVPAHATLVTIDQIIFQNGTGVNYFTTPMSGTLDITVTGTNQLTIVMRNTSLDGAFTDGGSPSLMLLTGFGIQLPGVSIVGGSVTATGTPLNFGAGQTTNISNQWIYGNSSFDGYNTAGVSPVDGIVSSVSNGGADSSFTGGSPNGNPPGGPNYGAVSAFETQFGGSLAGVRDNITFVLNLSGPAPSVAAIDAGNVILAFGSPDTLLPEPSTYALYGLGIAMLVVSGWWQKRRSQGNRGLAA